MIANKFYYIAKIIVKQSPCNAFIFIGVGIFTIFLEIVSLGVSIEAILTISVNDDNLGRKSQYFLNSIGFDVHQSPIVFYSVLICLIYAFLIASRYLRRGSLVIVKRQYVEQLTVDLEKEFTPEYIKEVKVNINKIENTLNIAVFGLFCGFLIALLMVLDVSLAIILIVMGVIHISINLFPKNFGKQKNSKANENEFIKAINQKQLTENNTHVSILRSRFWDDHLKKSTKNAHQIALNNIMRGISLVAVLIDLHMEDATVIAVYPILMVFILGRFHQYLDALSSNLKKVKT